MGVHVGKHNEHDDRERWRNLRKREWHTYYVEKSVEVGWLTCVVHWFEKDWERNYLSVQDREVLVGLVRLVEDGGVQAEAIQRQGEDKGSADREVGNGPKGYGPEGTPHTFGEQYIWMLNESGRLETRTLSRGQAAGTARARGFLGPIRTRFTTAL